jgi:hypothetical protein
MVGSMSYYADRIAGPLWIDGETCVDIDRRSDEELRVALREIRDGPDRHTCMCQAAARRFRELVDFEADAEKIRQLLA